MITDSVRIVCMYVYVCMCMYVYVCGNLCKIDHCIHILDVFPWDLDTMILG